MSAPEAQGPYVFFMLVLSLFALLGLAANTLMQLDPASSTILEYADHTVCGLFFLDFLISLYRAPNRGSYVLAGVGSTCCRASP
jgi:voltage-gated potassium channel